MLTIKPFILEEWEYESVIVNTKNLERLECAWRRVIDKDKAGRLLEKLERGEGINIRVIWNNNRTAFVIKDEYGIIKMHLGKELSAGLIYHEYAHVILMKRMDKDNHGPLFTATLDMLLHKYEEDWL